MSYKHTHICELTRISGNISAKEIPLVITHVCSSFCGGNIKVNLLDKLVAQIIFVNYCSVPKVT